MRTFANLICAQFADVRALGSPEAAAERLLKQTLEEFMSTRLGSRKEAEVVSASQREVDGRLFYDVEVRIGCLGRGMDVKDCSAATFGRLAMPCVPRLVA